MATYDLPYAQEHLDELFQEALTTDDVIIVRTDGRSCQLLPLADVKEESLHTEEQAIPDIDVVPAAVPA